MTEPTLLSINAERLWDSLMHLATIGAYTDPASGLIGVNRLSLTDADAQARNQLVQWFYDAGLTVQVDEMGNIYGRREGTDPTAAPVMLGSHIDTVATAGAFDGCLGVLGALEIVRTLNDRGESTQRPLVVAAFTEEEGVRFGTDMLGSAVAAGRISLEQAHNLTDAAGARFGDELARIGYLGHEPARLTPPHAYLECHIEQGPTLLQERKTVGIVTGVQAISWQKVIIHGRAAHSGATPTELRLDAGVAAAQLVLHVREMVTSGRYGKLRGNVGYLQTFPGLPSVVPERAELTIDLRNPDDAAMIRAEQDLAAYLEALPRTQPGLEVETFRLARTQPVSFSEDIQRVLQKSADELGLSSGQLISGAGHDAQEIAAISPAAMVFVRGQCDGISHNPREYSTVEDCAAGVNVLANTAIRLANNET